MAVAALVLTATHQAHQRSYRPKDSVMPYRYAPQSSPWAGSQAPSFATLKRAALTRHR